MQEAPLKNRIVDFALKHDEDLCFRVNEKKEKIIWGDVVGACMWIIFEALVVAIIGLVFIIVGGLGLIIFNTFSIPCGLLIGTREDNLCFASIPFWPKISGFRLNGWAMIILYLVLHFNQIFLFQNIFAALLAIVVVIAGTALFRFLITPVRIPRPPVKIIKLPD